MYSLFLAIDANFRLKRRLVSSEAADPSFSDGWSYFVSESGYKAYLAEFSDLIVQKGCPGLQLKQNQSNVVSSLVHVLTTMQSMPNDPQRA